MNFGKKIRAPENKKRIKSPSISEAWGIHKNVRNELLDAFEQFVICRKGKIVLRKIKQNSRILSKYGNIRTK